MQTRPELLLLQKTMVVVEGVSRSLDPDFDMWSASEPVVRSWIEQNLGVGARLREAADGVSELGRATTMLPALLGQGARVAAQLDAATRDGIRLAPETVAEIGQAEGRGNRWSRHRRLGRGGAARYSRAPLTKRDAAMTDAEVAGPLAGRASCSSSAAASPPTRRST